MARFRLFIPLLFSLLMLGCDSTGVGNLGNFNNGTSGSTTGGSTTGGTTGGTSGSTGSSTGSTTGGSTTGGTGNSSNTAPTAADDTASFNMNSPKNTIAVIGNDSDGDNDSLQITTVSTPNQGGEVRISDDGQNVIYDAPVNYTGTETFTYTISDGNGGSANATVTVTLNAFNNPNPARPCITERTARRAADRPYCYDVTIPAGFDGHTIHATVFAPVLEPGETAPVILHTHGFGESRFASLENPNAFMINRVTAQALLELWHDGYWVVSYDQRGFNANVIWGPGTPAANDPCAPPGNDTGCIDIMSPEREARDPSVVIDWIIANIREGFDPETPANTPATSTAALFDEDAPGDPVLGTIGLSYGGGFQTVGSAVDKALNGSARVNAMVPTTTWFDLRYSLAPHDVPKSGWLDFLGVATALGGTPPFGPFFTQAAAEAMADQVSDTTFDGLYQRSVRSYCENKGDDNLNGTVAQGTGSVPAPDVFIIQAQRDTLFNFNEGYDLAKCYADANPGSDVRLLIQTEGHVLAAAQPPSYKGMAEVIYIDEAVPCGPNTTSSRQMIIDWFNEKIGGQANAAASVPKVCITHFLPQAAPATGTALASLNDVLIGGTSVTLDSDASTAAVEPITFTVQPNPVTQATAIPVAEVLLHTAAGTEVLAGIPLLDIDVDVTGPPDPSGALFTKVRFFVGMGVRRASGGLEIIADQITPIHGPAMGAATNMTFSYPRTDEHGLNHGEDSGDSKGKIIGIGSQLSAGDQVVLLFFDQHPLFNSHGVKAGAYNVSVSGTIDIPLLP